jgi:hypothetical protein
MTPDTSSYYHAAYVVVGLIYLAYAGLLWRRVRYVRARLSGSATRDPGA